MKQKMMALVALMTVACSCNAQRVVDKLDRGLVAMKLSKGVFLSWRVLGEEYYDVQYNVYRDGVKINDVPLSVSNYTDAAGSVSNSYAIKAVVRGVEQQTASAAKQPWANAYKEIVLEHKDIKSTLIPNDACCADVDGDGELEILMKFDNLEEMQQNYPKNGPTIGGVETKEYSIFECLKQDGTRLWWVNCGPNMGDFQNNEQNIVAYDWDGDGKAEAVMRAADGTVIHMADGKTYTVGNASSNIRNPKNPSSVEYFVTTDGEYLLYLNGETGKPYQCLPYPLKRLESGETDLNKAWGDGYGHRCSKHFFGAPYFDGRKPSIFLARGIYTRHKMIAYNVNPSTHQLEVRWTWTCNSNGPWKGQGYHNYCVADVDWDGRDEIVFGSMVIDDNGKGLSTTGLGHGDAEHVGDFNPYVHGSEIFACQEDQPGTNYRDATTSKFYYRYQNAPKDVGRCMAGNFSNTYPGAIGTPTGEGPINLVQSVHLSGLVEDGLNQNFRIYWDGDLCEETFNYVNGKNTEGCIAKYGSWSSIYTCPGSQTNNDTKGTPCYQGDIFGDWREEIIMRTANNNIRIYSTQTPTTYRIPTLWHDHQYRNAMVWQMCGYNQPPRPSYFLGEMEGITVAPPPLIMTDREEVASGGTIGTSLNGKHVIVCETKNSAVTIEQGAKPAVLTFNVPTWVQGTASSECTTKETEIKYLTYTCTVTGGGIAGSARLVKQGDGILTLPTADFTHTGNTDIWAGVVNFDGTMRNSDVWLNRFAELNSCNGEFKSLKADYGSVIRPGGSGTKGNITTEALTLGFGSRLVVDLYGPDFSADMMKTKTLTIERKTGTAWVNAGPKYLMPIIELVGHPETGKTRIPAGKYVIATFEGALQGSASNLILEGLPTEKKTVYIEDNCLIVEILDTRDAGAVTWNGTSSTSWDLDITANFKMEDEEEAVTFVSNDDVRFDDNASRKSVVVVGQLYPTSVTVDNTSSYAFSGSGAICGDARFIKEGTGIVTMNGTNTYTGGNYLKGGTVKVSALSNQYGNEGNLGAITTSANKFTMENGAVLMTTAATESASPMKMVGAEGGVFNLGADFRMAAEITGTVLTKEGTGTLFTMKENANLQRLIIAAGGVAEQGGKPAATVEFQNGTLWDDGTNTTHAIHVPKGKSGTWQLTYTYYTAYNNKITGEGTLTIVPRNTVSRVRITGDWTQFEGTIKHTNKDIWLPLDMSSGMPKGTLDIAEGCGVCNTAKEFTVGQLTGKGSLVQAGPDFKSQTAVKGNNTWNVGNSAGNDFTFAGTFTDDGGNNKVIFNKIGTCTMTVTGKSDHSGGTAVKAGELIFKNGTLLGKGALTVASGATLSGATGLSNGLTNSSVTINAGGTLRVGVSPNFITGILAFNDANLTMARSSILEIGINGPATQSSTGTTSIQKVNRLSMNGTIKLHYLSGATDKLAEGDSIVIWKNVTTVTGTPVLDSESFIINAEKGLYWDTVDIKQGILRVAYDPTVGVRSIKAEGKGQQIYTLDGRRVEETRPGQVYIINGHQVLMK